MVLMEIDSNFTESFWQSFALVPHIKSIKSDFGYFFRFKTCFLSSLKAPIYAQARYMYFHKKIGNL